MLVFTSGKDGAEKKKKNVVANSKGIKVNAVDTTGAGDGFIGCLLYQMAKENVDLEQINILTEEQLKYIITLSTTVGFFKALKDFINIPDLVEETFKDSDFKFKI